MLPPPAPVVTIVQDYGGAMLPFWLRVDDYRRRGTHVRIEGECNSACTLVTALDRNLCVGPAAVLGFHQAYHPGAVAGDASDRSDAGTALFMRAYPARLSDWITRHGGLSKDWLVLQGAELLRMFGGCR